MSACLIPGESIVTEGMKNPAIVAMIHKAETPKSYSRALLVRRGLCVGWCWFDLEVEGSGRGEEREADGGGYRLESGY
jgi:hypothetical protein